MPNYISTLTGQQINDVMTQIDQGVPEGWAVGEKNGIPVSSSSPYYHNNAKYYAENALDSANRAEAAVPAGTAGAVFFDRTQTLTDSQKAQARQNIMAGGSNRNLLDNGWFFVNQRGITTLSTSTAQYTLDRWLASGSGSTITVNADKSVTIAKTAGTLVFTQRTELPKDYTKVYTLSVLLSNGEIFSKTGVFNAGTQGETAYQPTGMMSFYLGLWTQGGYLAPAIYLNANQTGNLTIKAVKLELGSVSTLANDAPPNYQQELAKCQRYFVRINGVNNLPIGVGFTRATYANVLVNLPVPMRGNAATVSSNATGFNMCAGTENTTATTVGFGDLQGSYLRLTFQATFTTQYRTVTAVFNGNYYIDISADL